mmetsp:Transcript_2146/g.5439  ORF Transcript_2146/g.5439 Transcript_2146/m.5439 type:complete len:104 (+) Transcript_2146:1446-1757(+)
MLRAELWRFLAEVAEVRVKAVAEAEEEGRVGRSMTDTHSHRSRMCAVIRLLQVALRCMQTSRPQLCQCRNQCQAEGGAPVDGDLNADLEKPRSKLCHTLERHG